MLCNVKKQMVSTQKYLEANREKINERKRNKYSSELRKAEYAETREVILKKGKEDRAICPLCNLDFRRLYIKKHIITRHKIDPPENLKELICVPIQIVE
jgi:hypothetical protein